MIYLGVSGGIDSSFALYLLKKALYDICAVFILFESIDSSCPLKCCNLDNVKKLTNAINVPLKIIDAREIFKKEIINYFIEEYKNGKAPNPCVICNEKVKFKILFENLFKEGDLISTGHYARIVKEGKNYYLKKGLDNEKDQSYMLYRLKKEYLPKIYFPLGEYKKSDVIKNFKKLNIFEEIPKESQDLCFITKDKNLFLKEIFNEKKGKIIHISGKELGEHNGYYFYTIGQRSGLNIAWKEPLYVVDIDIKNNILYVGERKFAYKDKFIIKKLNWLVDIDSIKDKKNIKVKTRYKGREINCEFEIVNESAIVHLYEKEFAITPGQSAVFYEDDIVLGGGEIDKVL
ncbi:MAG: tRNA 2-thiouridine(34) synthase MnmA [Caldisericia bacterium]|nr:tRNA 2-thiouridine(34) synthase MnmA [Caldisericia bacterium]